MHSAVDEGAFRRKRGRVVGVVNGAEAAVLARNASLKTAEGIEDVNEDVVTAHLDGF